MLPKNLENILQSIVYFFKLVVLMNYAYLFSKNNANAKVNQIQTNPNFLVGGSNIVSRTSNPKIIPNVAPKLQKMMECHSNAICIQKMVNAAAVIPK